MEFDAAAETWQASRMIEVVEKAFLAPERLATEDLPRLWTTFRAKGPGYSCLLP